MTTTETDSSPRSLPTREIHSQANPSALFAISAAESGLDLVQFAARLTAGVEDEYRRILMPYGLEGYAGNLAAGRLLRSRLAAVAAGEISERLIRRCVAMELLHTSTLIHDDILDEGTVRRGLPTLWKEVGLQRALLVGNLVATRALAIAHADSAELARAFLETFQRVNAAQLREVRDQGVLKTLATHEVIHIGKSSSTIELGLVVGAMSSPEWPVDLTHLRGAVREMGVGFQFVDDVEDVLAWLDGPGQVRSKTAAFDIEAGNLTLPCTLLLAGEGKQYEPGDRVTAEDLRSVSRNEWDAALEAAQETAADHFDRAERHLAAELEASGNAGPSRRIAEWVRHMAASWQRKGPDQR